MPQYIGAFNDTVEDVGLRDLAVHYLGLRQKVYQHVNERTGSTHEDGLFGFHLNFRGNPEVVSEEIAQAQLCLVDRLSPMLTAKTETIQVDMYKLVARATVGFDLWFSVRLSVSPR